MPWLSIVLGVLGLFTTGAVVPYLNRWVSNWGPRQHWLLGLMALFPAWLIAFLGLLPLVALLGIVFTDTAVRRLDKSGYFLSPFKYWLLGLAGLLPAWLITLWIIV